MAVHPVTIDTPEHVYRRLRRAAKHAQRPIEQMFAETVVAVTPVFDHPTAQERMIRADLSTLNDPALWRIARTTLSAEQRSRSSCYTTNSSASRSYQRGGDGRTELGRPVP